jgi:PilZ domain
MRSNADRERRRSSRVDFSALFTGEEALPPGGSPRKKRVFKGRIENISAGGVCVLSKQRPKESQLIRGHVKLPSLSIIIPTLMRVRWTLRRKGQYRVGLQFLL